MVIGVYDALYGGWTEHAPYTMNATYSALTQLKQGQGYDCGSAASCFQPDGSGYAAPPVYHNMSAFLFNSSNWGLNATLDWFHSIVQPSADTAAKSAAAAAARSATATASSAAATAFSAAAHASSAVAASSAAATASSAAAHASAAAQARFAAARSTPAHRPPPTAVTSHADASPSLVQRVRRAWMAWLSWWRRSSDTADAPPSSHLGDEPH